MKEPIFPKNKYIYEPGLFDIFFKPIKKLYYRVFPPNENKCYINNPSRTYLFMGGIMDKIIIPIPDNQWMVHFPDPNHLYVPLLYKKHILFTKNSRLAIYVLDSLPENQILDKLVESYIKK